MRQYMLTLFIVLFTTLQVFAQTEPIITTGIITTVAGNGTSGFSGAGGSATSTSLNSPSEVAVDSAGNLFFADHGNHRIRRVDVATQIITTVAGDGTRGFSGDGNPATDASLRVPSDVAIDAAGNLFIADYGNHRIRRVKLPLPTVIEIEEAETRVSEDEVEDNRMNFEGKINFFTAFTPMDVTVTIVSDKAPFNSIEPVTIPADEFQCVAGVCVAEVDDPSQSFMGEPLKLEVVFPLSGTGDFEVEVKNINTDASSATEVTLTIEKGTQIGSATTTETVKEA